MASVRSAAYFARDRSSFSSLNRFDGCCSFSNSTVSARRRRGRSIFCMFCACFLLRYSKPLLIILSLKPRLHKVAQFFGWIVTCFAQKTIIFFAMISRSVHRRLVITGRFTKSPVFQTKRKKRYLSRPKMERRKFIFRFNNELRYWKLG